MYNLLDTCYYDYSKVLKERHDMMEKTVVELFAGVGGFRVGLNNIVSFSPKTGLANENKKWDFVWANQWEPSTKIQPAYECYIKRFGEEHTSNQDITKFPKSDIPNHSLLVGGFPCQDYSVARTKSNEKGIEGKKGVLFWDIAEILEAKNTPFFLLENVDRLLKSPAVQRGRDFGIMLRTLDDLGYNVEWRVINAADYGRSQRRRRVFIFGWRKNLNYANEISKDNMRDFIVNDSLFASSFPINKESISSNRTINLKDYSDTVEMTESFNFLFENTGISIDGEVATFKSLPIFEKPTTLKKILDKKTDKSEFYLNDKQIEKFQYLKGSKKIKRLKPNGEVYYYSEGSMSETDSLDLPGRTMLTSEGTVNRSSHVIIDPNDTRQRIITPIEAERMQDFPDNWTNTGMTQRRRYFMMGNALVTGLIGRLEGKLSEIIEKE